MSPHHHTSVRDLWAGVRYGTVGAALSRSRSSSTAATTQTLEEEEEEEAVEKTVLSGQLLGCKCTAEVARREERGHVHLPLYHS